MPPPQKKSLLDQQAKDQSTLKVGAKPYFHTLNPKPYTLHPTPLPPTPDPYTLTPTPYTLHPNH